MLGQTGDIGSSHSASWRGNDSGIIGLLDFVSAVIMENRRLDGKRGSEVGFEFVVGRELVSAVANTVQDLSGHLQGQ